MFFTAKTRRCEDSLFLSSPPTWRDLSRCRHPRSLGFARDGNIVFFAPSRLRGSKILCLITLLCGLLLTANAAIIPAKAFLSVHLINHAWTRTLEGKPHARPWPWMDSEPFALLELPRLGIRQVILRGTTGEAMAFAPGWQESSAPPGSPGITVIAAHRDTHFTFLKDVRNGEHVRLQDKNGKWHNYTLTRTFITEIPSIDIGTDETQNTLLLSTCYPFNALSPHTPRRFVAMANRITTNPHK